MAKVRETKLTIVTGIKRIGKSYTTYKLCYIYHKGVKETGFYPRKVLIYDTNNEYASFEVDPSDTEGLQLLGNKPVYVDAIDLYNIPLFSAQKVSEMRRVAPIHLRDVKDKKGNIIARQGTEWSGDDRINNLLYTIKNFRGGLLWIEDASSIFGDQIPRAIMAFITQNAHRDLDIILHLQSIAPILPRLWQNCEWTRFHKQNDGVDASRTKLKEKYPMYKIAEKLVWRQYFAGNTRYYVWINNPEQYIKGAITREMAETAIRDFLSENFNELRSIKNKRNDEGKLVNDYKTAMQHQVNHYYNTYFRYLNK